MYRYKKRPWICELCGKEVEFLGLKDGKHVCGECSNHLVRDLRMVEKRGTKIQRKDGIGDIMVIRGMCKESAIYPESGYFVSDINYSMPFPVILPFNKISEWEVLEE